MRIDEWLTSLGDGPVDDATMRVVFATGQTFITEERTLTNSTVTLIVSDDAAAKTLQAADPAIHGTILRNDADKDAFVKLGLAASSTDFTRLLSPGEEWDVPFRYVGDITAIWKASPAGGMNVTILRE